MMFKRLRDWFTEVPRIALMHRCIGNIANQMLDQHQCLIDRIEKLEAQMRGVHSNKNIEDLQKTVDVKSLKIKLTKK